MDLELFPYAPRKGQRIVYLKVREAIENKKNLVLEAPTGFGKTITVLSAALAENKKIFWLSRTGNAILRPISELEIINKFFGTVYEGVAIRGKKDMCPLYRGADREAFAVLCRRCKRGVKKIGGIWTFSRIYEEFAASKYCPYKIQWDLAERADVVSFNYNYLFGENFRMLAELLSGDDVLVIDEAHNIVDAANSNFSDTLTVESLERAIKEAEKLGLRKLGRKIEEIKNYLEDRGRVSLEYVLETFEIEEVIPEAWEATLMVYEKQLRQGKTPRSSLGRFVRFWRKAMPPEDGIFLIVHRDAFELYDVRAGVFFKRIWSNFSSVIAMSGTLAPVQAFMLTAGLEDAEKVVVRYMAERARFYAIRGLTTKGESLPEAMKTKYMEFLKWVLDKYNKNTAIFTASYRILEEFRDWLEKYLKEKKRKLFVEKRDLDGRTAERMLQEFKGEKAAVLLAPCGGRFAESADFPGKTLEVAVLVGIPFEKPDLKTQLKIEYYTKLFGKQARILAYTAPAIRKAAQAIGRAVRGPEDSAVVFLADERYLKRTYFQMLPYHVKAQLKAISINSLLQKKLYA